ncbi:hypothetical protein GCM10010174_22470 [Kutzneria viridogrisea]|uniref:Sugar phosphate permease n=2 Tax=Kutzneria TaxID=43356 RepID=A0ABR6BST7_9PSEU|nr:hypothetical protein [Kutzneria albida]AHH94281.1 putative secreted protein [Kutzneria albida DSM 43870]MBA8929945.1 sugar phosphate permease [Kutzneria viridogrisea]
MIKTVRGAAAGAVALVLTVLFAAQAQAAPGKAAAVTQQGDWDVVFAGVVGLAMLGLACGVIFYAARHRDAER